VKQHVRSYDGDSDSPWRVVCTFMYDSYSDLTKIAFFGAKEIKHDFWLHKSTA
jgi:hypothetical protein